MNKWKYIETKILDTDRTKTWQSHKQAKMQAIKETKNEKKEATETDYAASKRLYV